MNRKNVPFFVILLSGILLSACSTKDEKPERPEFDLRQGDDIPDEEYEVYSVILENHTNSSTILISQESLEESGLWEGISESHPELDTMMISNFIEASQGSYYFDNNFTSQGSDIHLISPEEKDYISNFQNFEIFRNDLSEEYPGSNGVRHFSRIGFNNQGDQALVKTTHLCGPGCYSGSIYHLKKENDEWEISQVVVGWIT